MSIVSRRGFVYEKPVARVVARDGADYHYPPHVDEGEIVERYFTQSADPKHPERVYVQTFRMARRGDNGDEAIRWDCGCANYLIELQRVGPTYICKHLSARFAELAAERAAARCNSCVPHMSPEEKQAAYEAFM